jgi:hypothetical protein
VEDSISIVTYGVAELEFVDGFISLIINFFSSGNKFCKLSSGTIP